MGASFSCTEWERGKCCKSLENKAWELRHCIREMSVFNEKWLSPVWCKARKISTNKENIAESILGLLELSQYQKGKFRGKKTDFDKRIPL